MNNNRETSVFCGILCLIFLIGCSPSVVGVSTPSPIVTTREVINPSITPITQPVTTPKATLAPTSTEPQYINTPLAEGEANQKLLEYLTENGGCKLPCLWGITPGNTLFRDAINLAWPLSNISLFTDHADGLGSIEPVYTLNDLFILTSLNFLSDPHTGIVEQMSFDVGAYRKYPDASYASGYSYSPVLDSTDFGKIAAKYMISGILTNNGRPDSALVLTYGGPTGDYQYNDFDLVLLYPDQGMLVHYSTKKQLVGGNIIGCMANVPASFILAPSGNRTAFAEFLDKTEWKDKILGYTPLDKITSMTMDTFYQTFRQLTDKCISIENKLLPTWVP